MHGVSRLLSGQDVRHSRFAVDEETLCSFKIPLGEENAVLSVLAVFEALASDGERYFWVDKFLHEFGWIDANAGDLDVVLLNYTAFSIFIHGDKHMAYYTRNPDFTSHRMDAQRFLSANELTGETVKNYYMHRSCRGARLRLFGTKYPNRNVKIQFDAILDERHISAVRRCMTSDSIAGAFVDHHGGTWAQNGREFLRGSVFSGEQIYGGRDTFDRRFTAYTNIETVRSKPEWGDWSFPHVYASFTQDDYLS